jgi:hypothetical protein
MALLFQYGNIAASNREVLRDDAARIADAYDNLFDLAMSSPENDLLILKCMAEISDSARLSTTKGNRISQGI